MKLIDKVTVLPVITTLDLDVERVLQAAIDAKPKHVWVIGEWVGLTDEEMETLYYGNADTITGTEIKFGRAVEAKLKEKNT